MPKGQVDEGCAPAMALANPAGPAQAAFRDFECSCSNCTTC